LSSDREEIKWKHQALIENVGSVIDAVETERKLIENRVNKFIKTLDGMRKHWFTGLAVIITIALAFILEKDLSGWYFLGIILPAMTAFVIFFATNLKIARFETIYSEIDNAYYNMIRTELYPLKGVVTAYALEDLMTMQKTTNLINYVRMCGIAIGFLLEKYVDEKVELNEFDKKEYTENYEFTKNNLESIKKEDFETGTKIIEEFIKDYESMK